MTANRDTYSRSAASVESFLAMEILERAQELERAGVDVVHLEVGEPDFPVPPCVAEAMDAAVRSGRTHYTHSLGVLELRGEISRYYASRYDVEVSPERVLVTTGSSGGLALLMGLLLDPGDEVLLPNPGYACYPNFVRAFHGSPRFFSLDPRNGFHYDVDEIRGQVTERTRAVMVNSPANPTAAVEARQTLERLAELPVPVISDEIYHGLEYGPKAPSLLELTRDGFVIDGFSKRYAMTGLRIGWLVAPAAAVGTLQKLQQNLFICAGSVVQEAAIAVLRHGRDAVEAMRREYEGRRAVLLDGVRSLGFPVPAEPVGAYYVLADARHIDRDSLRLAKTILEEAHVGVTPGVDFGSCAEGYLRFSFASSREHIEEGLRRLRAWLGSRQTTSSTHARSNPA